jgi:hypothetical protein
MRIRHFRRHVEQEILVVVNFAVSDLYL